MRIFEAGHEKRRGSEATPVNITCLPGMGVVETPTCQLHPVSQLGFLTRDNKLIANDSAVGLKLLALVEARRAA